MALDYLIHLNDDSKYQYSIDEVKGNLKQKLEKIIKNNNKDENEKANELITYIENYIGILRVSEFAKYSSDIGMWDVFRRASIIYLNPYKLRENATSHNTYYVNFCLLLVCKLY